MKHYILEFWYYFLCYCYLQALIFFFLFTGLFDSSVGSDFIGKEIVKCFKFASDGIHAVVAVFSVRSRFSVEEYAAIKGLLTIFGEKISNYMIVVFTGGDELEENDETLEDYLGRDCPELLKVKLFYCTLLLNFLCGTIYCS